MSMYRIYKYPCKQLAFRHLYIKRDRGVKKNEPDHRSILECINEFHKLDESLSRSRRNIRDYILCNRFEYFCTFTFNPNKIDRYNWHACKKYISVFFNHFRVRYAPDFCYLVVPEFHKDGAVHFHGVCSGFPSGELVTPDKVWKRDKRTGDLSQVPNSHGYMDWPRWRKNAGWFNCSKIRDYERCAFYVTKYVTKDLAKLRAGQQVFLCSKGLKKPELIYDETDIPLLFEPTFENEYVASAFTDEKGIELFFGSGDAGACEAVPDWIYEALESEENWNEPHVVFERESFQSVEQIQF